MGGTIADTQGWTLTPYPKGANKKMLPFVASCKCEFEYLSNILMLIRII